MDLTRFFEITIYGNSVQIWLLALLTTAATLLILQLVKRIISQRALTLAAKTSTDLDDFVFGLLNRTNSFFLIVLSFYVGSLVLSLSEEATTIITDAVIITFFIQVGIWGSSLIAYSLDRYQRRYVETKADHTMLMTALNYVGKLVLWSVILLLTLDNLGVEITALVAGLGIGGIAVGLALQNILGDLFASLSIVLDKPFEIGDFIIVDDFLGTVEKVGLKTTRVRSLFGEQLIFANSDLLQSRIRNYKRMEERRIVFSLGVTYQTPYEKLATIPAMLREIIEAQDQVRFDRAHFKEYGDFSLNFEVVYYVLNPDYNLYMDIQQDINLAIFRRFEEKGIEFAYPTQTLHIDGKLKNVFTERVAAEPSRN